MWLLDSCPDFVGMEGRTSLQITGVLPFHRGPHAVKRGGADSARLSGSRQAARSAQIAVCYLLGGMGEITHTQMTRR